MAALSGSFGDAIGYVLEKARDRRRRRRVREAIETANRSAPRLVGSDAADAEDRGPDAIDVMIYFADQADNLYQLDGWEWVFRRLAESYRLCIVTRDAGTAEELLRGSSPIPIDFCHTHGELDDLVARRRPDVVVYLNHHVRNFEALWHNGPIHVFCGHGESDKPGVSDSHQLKAYDFVLVAGPVGREKIARRVRFYDADRWVLEAGRPQLSAPISMPAYPRTTRPVTVAYAPTWEGDRSRTSYGSAVDIGVAAVRSLLRDPTIRVIFRPHPLSGKRDPAYRTAVRAIADDLRQAAAADPGTGHWTDESADGRWLGKAADIAIVDVSAMAVDWLATSRPLILACTPAALAASHQSSPTESAPLPSESLMRFLVAVPTLCRADAADAADMVTRTLNSPDVSALAELRNGLLGASPVDDQWAKFERVFAELILRARQRDEPSTETEVTRP